jgi:hypothetical protein
MYVETQSNKQMNKPKLLREIILVISFSCLTNRGLHISMPQGRIRICNGYCTQSFVRKTSLIDIKFNALKLKIHLKHTEKKSVPISQKTNCVFITKTNRLRLFTYRFVVYSVNHKR